MANVTKILLKTTRLTVQPGSSILVNDKQLKCLRASEFTAVTLVPQGISTITIDEEVEINAIEGSTIIIDEQQLKHLRSEAIDDIIIDVTPPVITGSTTKSFASGELFNVSQPWLWSDISALDETDGDVTQQIVLDEAENPNLGDGTAVAGLYNVTYYVSDSSANQSLPFTIDITIEEPVGLLSVEEKLEVKKKNSNNKKKTSKSKKGEK